MGKPATAYFCGNGHLMDSAGHGEFCEIDLIYEASMYSDEEPIIPSCKECDSTDVFEVIEWGNRDCYLTEEDDSVPLKPLREDDKEMVDHYENKYFVKIPVFDISKLRKMKNGY